MAHHAVPVGQSMKQLVEWCAGDSRSAEMRYESAWRMGQWQSSAQQSGAAPGRPVGTNEAVLGCLKVSFSPVSHPHPSQLASRCQ